MHAFLRESDCANSSQFAVYTETLTGLRFAANSPKIFIGRVKAFVSI